MRIEMELHWVAFASVLPFALALAVAWPFWRARVRDEMGSIVAAGVVLLCSVGFIAREYGEIKAVTERCIAQQIGCHFHPDGFTRYSVFAGIALVQTCVLFLTGLGVEERLRRREQCLPALKDGDR
jgi:hypothetical protein